jgi:DNA (cytosine-5)-methyltransferase 1
MQYTVISTFAGCGGSSLGYRNAGFKELLAIDYNENCVKTFKKNFPNVPIWKKDVRKITSKEILEFCKIDKNDLDILDGSPPCQGFSTAGNRKVADLRNTLFLDFIKLINGLQPKVFIMENVSGQIFGNMKGMFKEILISLKNTGYNVKAKLMDTKYYEIPQSRKRIFYIGVRSDLNIAPSFPKPNNKMFAVKAALKNIKNNDLSQSRPVTKPIKKILPFLKFGETAGKYHPKGSYFNTSRCYFNRPSRTVTKTMGLVHPLEDRYLTIQEVKRLCSFPDDFEVVGAVTAQWAQLGNAVMPKQMQAIAETVSSDILDKYYGKTQ